MRGELGRRGKARPGAEAKSREGWSAEVGDFMRTLLRDMKRGVYYQGGGQWTRSHHRALDFELIDKAVRHARRTGLMDVEVVFAFNNPPSLAGVPLERLDVQYAEEAVCPWL